MVKYNAGRQTSGIMKVPFGQSLDFENSEGGTHHPTRSSLKPAVPQTKFGKALREVEKKVEAVFDTCENVIPFFARLFLVMTFIDNGVRMYTYYSFQHKFFTGKIMGWSPQAAAAFIALSMAMQLGGSVSVLWSSARSIDLGVALLGANVIMQQIAYSPLWSWSYFSRGLALLGALAMIMCEATHSTKLASQFEITHGTKDKVKPYVQLVGRVVIVLMDLALVHTGMSGARTVLLAVNLVLVLCVAVGFRARMAAFLLCSGLFVSNQFMNPFWNEPNMIMKDYIRYEYFHIMSVIGGLLAVVAMGSGEISVDHDPKKKI